MRHYEDAPDAVASAIYHICRRVVDLHPREAMRPWIHTIVRHETHHIRRGKYALHMSLGEAYSMGAQDPSPLLSLGVECALRL